MRTYLFLLLLSACYVGNTQNVGIGTNSPSEKLQVAGNIKLDTLKPKALQLLPNAAEGKILTSDAAGNASWQANTSATGANAFGNIGYGLWGNCETNATVVQYHPVENVPYIKDEAFGLSVSISGNFAIVGAPYGTNRKGSASIFAFDGSKWNFMQQLTDITGLANDEFGISVSIWGNYAVVGAHADALAGNAGQGSASIYKFNGTSWGLMEKIIDATGAAGDNFGISVAISGNQVIIGADKDNVGANADQGSASIYKYNNVNGWVLVNKLTDVAGKAMDNYGRSVSISGSYAIVGAPGVDNFTHVDQGSATIYQFTGGNWVFMDGLTDAVGEASDNFGSSVSIDGNYAMVGASNDQVDTSISQGSACAFKLKGTTWELMKKIIDPTGGKYDHFGSSICISGNYAIIGSLQDKVGNNLVQGSASIYLRIGNSWGELQHLTDPRGEAYDQFGQSVAMDGTSQRFLVGTGYYWTGLHTTDKAVFGKVY